MDVEAVAVSVIEMEIAPPSFAVQFVNVVCEVDVPPTLRVFPSSSVAEIAAPPAEERLKEVNEHDVMDRLALLMEMSDALSDKAVVVVEDFLTVMEVS